MLADASDVYDDLAARGVFTIKPAKRKPPKHTDPTLTGRVILQRIAQGAYLDGPDGWARLLSDAITVTNNGEAFFVDRKSWTTNHTANRTAVGKLRAAIRAAIEPRIPRFGTPSAGRPRSKTAQAPANKRQRSPPAGAAPAASPATPASVLEAKRKEATGIQTQIRGLRRRKEAIETEVERRIRAWDVGDAANEEAENTAEQEKITLEQEQESLKQALKDMDAKVADANANATAKAAIRIAHNQAKVELVAAGVQKQANEDEKNSAREMAETKVLAEIKELERNQRIGDLEAEVEEGKQNEAAANAQIKEGKKKKAAANAQVKEGEKNEAAANAQIEEGEKKQAAENASVEAAKAEVVRLRKRAGDGSDNEHDTTGSPAKRLRPDGLASLASNVVDCSTSTQ